jgi:hypothetical protein
VYGASKYDLSCEICVAKVLNEGCLWFSVVAYSLVEYDFHWICLAYDRDQ